MKCWKLTFNAWGSRVIIVPSCTSKIVKIFVAIVEVHKKKERQDENLV
jgi:hypothetical protein